jgi:alcohol dehydrogenase
MRALVYDAFEAPPEVRTVPDPTPSDYGVVVEVGAVGLCRSDWHGWMGHDADIDTLPHVPGHELAGVIRATGPAVEEWQVGDRVTVPFVGGCGRCATCRRGDPHVCPHQFQPGFTAWGALAEYVALNYADANLVALPDAISDVAAASIGCRFATAFRAVVDQGAVRSGQWVAVHGCGGVGLSAVMIARALGAQVVAVDISDAALERAADLGAAVTINAASTDDVAAAVRDYTGGGAHVSMDAFGAPDTCYQSVASLRKRGRHVQVGLLGAAVDAPVPMARVIADELELRGVHGLPAHRYPDLLAMVEAGTLRPERLVGRTISLDDAGAALMAFGASGSDTPAGVTVVDSL